MPPRAQEEPITVHVYCDYYNKTRWTNDYSKDQPCGIILNDVHELLRAGRLGGIESIRRDQLTLHYIPEGIEWTPNLDSFRDQLNDSVKADKAERLHSSKRIGNLFPAALKEKRTSHVFLFIGTDSNTGDPELLTSSDMDDEHIDLDGDNDEEDKDKATPLQAKLNRFLKQFSPSHAAQLKNYAWRQGTEFAYHDGRHTREQEIDTRDLPVELYSPSFALFKSRLNDDTHMPQEYAINHIIKFMRASAVIYSSEAERVGALHAAIDCILEREAENKKVGKANPDGCISYDVTVPVKDEIGSITISVPVVVFEHKVEPGAGGCDAAVQALSSIEHFWAAPHRDFVMQKTRCDTLAVAMDGPWMRIYGCVHTNRWVFQPMAKVYTGFSSSIPVREFLDVARVFAALCSTMNDIIKRTRRTLQESSAGPNDCSALALPAPHRFGQYTLNYRRAITFGATPAYSATAALLHDSTTEKNVVVLFTEQYGMEVHKFLAGWRPTPLAPKLLFCGAPYEHDVPGYTNIHMVVIDYDPSSSQHPGVGSVDAAPRRRRSNPHDNAICKAVRDAVSVVHSGGWVLGNVSDATIVHYRSDNGIEVRILNFVCAGKAGTARYPIDLLERDLPADHQNPEGPMRLVTTDHDDFWLNVFFPLST